MADNEAQGPAEYPRYGWPGAEQAASADPAPGADTAPPAPVPPAPVPPTAAQPTAAQPPAAQPPAPMGYPAGGYQAGGYQAGACQPPSGGYQIPPGGYYAVPAGYQGNGGYPMGGYQPGGYPPGGYQAGAHQVRMNASMRAAAADRERTVDVLKAGFTEGRLTQDEYNDRMGRAYAARTYGELTTLIADLPSGAMPVAWPAPAVYQPPASTNSTARASLILGVAEFFTMGLTAIPAVICGHVAKHEIRQTGQRGDGLATAGLVLGYMAIIFWVVIIAMSVLGAAIQMGGGGVS